MLVAETISFGDTVERLVELLLVVLVGVCLTTHWDLRAVPLALLLMLVIRPVATRLLLAGTPTTNPQRWLMGWFGIRGIGSLYYLSYALSHGVSGSNRDRAGGGDDLRRCGQHPAARHQRTATSLLVRAKALGAAREVIRRPYGARSRHGRLRSFPAACSFKSVNSPASKKVPWHTGQDSTQMSG